MHNAMTLNFLNEMLIKRSKNTLVCYHSLKQVGGDGVVFPPVIVPELPPFHSVADSKAHIVPIDGKFKCKSVRVSIVGAKHSTGIVAGPPSIMTPSDGDLFGIGQIEDPDYPMERPGLLAYAFQNNIVSFHSPKEIRLQAWIGERKCVPRMFAW